MRLRSSGVKNFRKDIEEFMGKIDSKKSSVIKSSVKRAKKPEKEKKKREKKEKEKENNAKKAKLS